MQTNHNQAHTNQTLTNQANRKRLDSSKFRLQSPLRLFPKSIRRIPRPIRCLLVLSLCGAGLISPLTLAPVLAQTPTAASLAAKEKLLRQRLVKAGSVYETARQVVIRYPAFKIQGTVEESRPNVILVYGVTIPTYYTPKNSLGWSNEKRFLTVRNYNPADLNGGSFYGMVMAVSQNEFTALPVAYNNAASTMNKYEAIIESIEGELAAIATTRQKQRKNVAQVQQAKAQALANARWESLQRQKVAEARKLIAQFQARYAKDAATSSDADFLQLYGEDAKKYYQSLVVKGDADAGLYEPLRETAIVQLVRAATLRAKTGALEASGELLKSSLWWSGWRFNRRIH